MVDHSCVCFQVLGFVSTFFVAYMFLLNHFLFFFVSKPLSEILCVLAHTESAFCKLTRDWGNFFVFVRSLFSPFQIYFGQVFCSFQFQSGNNCEWIETCFSFSLVFEQPSSVVYSGEFRPLCITLLCFSNHWFQ